VVIAALAALVTSLVAVLIRWLPESASEEMDRIIFTYWFATIISIGIFALVSGVIVYAVWTFRAQPDDDTDGPPIHGHTGLEVAWTVVPAVLVIAIGIVSAVVLSKNADAGSDPLKVKVFAQQFAWRFVYDGDIRSNELVMPVDRAVEFELESADVIHSIWIPEMGQKQDVVPGVTTEIVITPTRTGRFTLICTELCGLGHSTMRAPVRVLPPAAFGEWLRRQRQGSGTTTGDGATGGTTTGGGAAGGTVERGSETFAQAGCGGCHALAKAGTDAQIGPPLDDLAAAAERAGMPVAEFVRQSIVDPDAVITPDYQPGVMPKDFGESLSPDELDALVAYVSGEGS
ncbi:MAG TPA: cytochrome c oxidase subunit II, partial [Candidatus Limnocylindrales bacterium]|nr:cytochrome c oxidase subunit II [Candidatus Limnocylindrales bacterium]